MMGLLMIMVKTSLILALGMLAAFALRRRSAALRHWILAAAIICAAAAPVIGSLRPVVDASEARGICSHAHFGR